jgi:hypothetical protein
MFLIGCTCSFPNAGQNVPLFAILFAIKVETNHDWQRLVAEYHIATEWYTAAVDDFIRLSS